jgi:hypothetical protein
VAAFLWWRAYADFADSVRSQITSVSGQTPEQFLRLSAKRVTNVCAAFYQGRFFGGLRSAANGRVGPRGLGMRSVDDYLNVRVYGALSGTSRPRGSSWSGLRAISAARGRGWSAASVPVAPACSTTLTFSALSLPAGSASG